MCSDLGSLFKGQMKTAKFKSAYNFLIIGPGGLQCNKPTYRKSWIRNMFRFNLGPLLQGQTRIAKLKGAYK